MGKTSTEVKQRWNAANYKRYPIYLRIQDDADLIAFIEKNKANGTTELFRSAISEYRANHKELN